MDKLVSSYGHCEISIDATSLYQEMVDVIFRHETMTQFARNIWFGIPTLEIVIDDDGGIQTLSNDIEEGEEVSVSEMLQSFSVEEQVEIIQRALENGDAAVLRAIPVKRQSVWPEMASFLLSMGYQLEMDEHNTLVLGGTQYVSDMANASNLYHRMNVEWHCQFSRLTKVVTSGTVGTGTLSSQCTVSRTLNARTTLEVQLHFNFMDSVWTQFADIMMGRNDEKQRIENAADLFLGENTMKSTDSESGRVSAVAKGMATGIGSVWWMATNLVNALYHRSVGALFDVSFGIRRILTTEWMATSSIRIGRWPSMRWNVAKTGGSKRWNFDIELGGSALSVSAKRENEWEKTMLFYHSMALDARNLFKFECGFTKRLVDHDVDEESELEMRCSLGLCLSLSEGLSIRCGLKRGPSHFAVPIKLTQSTPRSMKPILLSTAVAVMMYHGYRRYVEPFSVKRRDKVIRERLNEKGRRLLNQRQFAMKQQSIMRRQCDRIRREQEESNGLVILAAFYGVNVEAKLVDAVREQLDFEKEHDDHTANDNENENTNEDEDDEKAINVPVTENGAAPPLWFSSEAKEHWNDGKERDVDSDRKFRVNLNDIDWSSIEPELESEMMNDDRTDIDLPPFLNVRVVLQYMVNVDSSTLSLSSGSKAALPGFSECCCDGLGNKELTVVYRHGTNCKMVTVSDVMPLTVPSDSDRQWIDCRQRTH